MQSSQKSTKLSQAGAGAEAVCEPAGEVRLTDMSTTLDSKQKSVRISTCCI
ncbi:hypothetical protein HMPREF0972_01684 [Actinomyces sp. oral taxon 848 str. F0332]|nr:hypothetical protein HMPREF0972_01684 [Actinomyces sp. oral taxon 848 str. F0332]